MLPLGKFAFTTARHSLGRRFLTCAPMRRLARHRLESATTLDLKLCFALSELSLRTLAMQQPQFMPKWKCGLDNWCPLKTRRGTPPDYSGNLIPNYCLNAEKMHSPGIVRNPA